jgi:hypothetical protein
LGGVAVERMGVCECGIGFTVGVCGMGFIAGCVGAST